MSHAKKATTPKKPSSGNNPLSPAAKAAPAPSPAPAAAEPTKEKEKDSKDKKDKKKKDDENPPKYFTARRKVILDKEYTVGDTTVLLREFENVKTVDGSSLIDATPVVGVSASLASSYLVRKLQLPVVADLNCDEFPQAASVTEWDVSNGVRIYGNDKITLLVSDFQLGSSADNVTRVLLKVVLDFCARHNIKLLLTIDGFDRDKKETEIGGGMGGEEEDDEEGGGKTTINLKDFEDDDGEGEDEEDEEEREKAKKKKELEKAKKKKEKEKKKLQDKKKQGKDSKKAEKEKEEEDEEEDESDSDEEKDKEKDGVYYLTNEEALGMKLKDMNAEPMKEGSVKGLTGAIIRDMPTSAVPIVGLFTSHATKSITDAKMSTEVIKIISALTGVTVDTKALLKDIRKIDRKLKEVISMLKQDGAKSKRAAQSMYM